MQGVRTEFCALHRGGPPRFRLAWPDGAVHNQPMTNEELVKRYAEAMVAHDFDTLEKLRHPEWCSVWPQSGEVLRGNDTDRAMMAAYPGGMPRFEPKRLLGSEDRWAVSPLGGVYRVAGEGENWWGEWRMTYPDGRMWFTIDLIELRDGKVWRETTYWAEPFEAPEWRSHFVERLPTD